MQLHLKNFCIPACFLLIFLISLGIYSQAIDEFDTLAGPLPAFVKAQDKPYFVIADIEVPANRIVTIEPGAIFLFKNFTGFHIEGKLLAQGTATRPIVFTSQKDQTYNFRSKLLPTAYDWDGIYIHENAMGTIMKHCQVGYTVWGINSDTKFIRLENITFIENGKADFSLNGQAYPIIEQPFNYGLTPKEAQQEGLSKDLFKDPLAVKRNLVRYSSLVMAMGGIGSGIYFITQLKKSWPRWKDVNDPEKGLYYAEYYPASIYEDYRKQKNQDILLVILGMGLGCTGTLGFTWSFSF